MNYKIQYLKVPGEMDKNYLLDILKGCFDPQRINQYQFKLQQASNHPKFLETLLTLIPGQQYNLLMMILSTFKNYLSTKYDTDGQNTLPIDQSELIKENILSLFYQLQQNQNAILMYHEICKLIIKKQYPWEGINQLLEKDLQQEIIAGVHFCTQIAAYYEYEIHLQKRTIFQKFIESYFPRMQTLIESILSNYNFQTAKLLQEILKTFYSCFHVQIPIYLRDFQKIDKWILYFKTILAAPIQINPSNIILTTRILEKFLKMYTSVNQDGKQYKGWSLLFIKRYAVELYNLSLQYITIGNQQASGVILKCIYNICQNQNLRELIKQEHCEGIIYINILPNLQRNSQDLKCFNQDGIQYIRRGQDLSYRTFRNNAFDLLEIIMKTLSFNGKAQIIKFIQYSASVLQNRSIKDQEKQIVVHILIRLSNLILKNKYLKKQLQPLTQQLLLPILSENKPILVSHTLQLLQKIIPHTNWSRDSMKKLMEIVYGHMTSEIIVVKFFAALCFTALLSHQQAREQVKPHFEKILQIYVKMLDMIDHEKLLLSLQKIVKNFEQEIIPVAVDLVNHLLNMFYSYSNRRNDNNQEGEQDDNNNSATAAINTIEEIVKANLSNQQYQVLSPKILQIFKNLFVDYGPYLVQGLNLMSSFVFHSPGLTDYEFTYVICRKLLQGNNQIVNYSNLNQEDKQMIIQTEKTDLEYCENIIAILKNLIKKMPIDLLLKYPLPKNPQLLLCIIQNKKLPTQALSKLDTSEVAQSKEWSDIIQSYTAEIYGIGSVSDPQYLKIISGVSLFPWLKHTFGPVVVKKILFITKDDQEEFQQQNTLQMMERYAREQQQDEEQYNAHSGINYSFKYQSPYDSQKDKELMMSRLKNLTNQQALVIMNNLSQQNKKKLEQLFV